MPSTITTTTTTTITTITIKKNKTDRIRFKCCLFCWQCSLFCFLPTNIRPWIVCSTLSHFCYLLATNEQANNQTNKSTNQQMYEWTEHKANNNNNNNNNDCNHNNNSNNTTNYKLTSLQFIFKQKFAMFYDEWKIDSKKEREKEGECVCERDR